MDDELPAVDDYDGGSSGGGEGAADDATFESLFPDELRSGVSTTATTPETDDDQNTDEADESGGEPEDEADETEEEDSEEEDAAGKPEAKAAEETELSIEDRISAAAAKAVEAALEKERQNTQRLLDERERELEEYKAEKWEATRAQEREDEKARIEAETTETYPDLETLDPDAYDALVEARLAKYDADLKLADAEAIEQEARERETAATTQREYADFLVSPEAAKEAVPRLHAPFVLAEGQAPTTWLNATTEIHAAYRAAGFDLGDVKQFAKLIDSNLKAVRDEGIRLGTNRERERIAKGVKTPKSGTRTGGSPTAPTRPDQSERAAVSAYSSLIPDEYRRG